MSQIQKNILGALGDQFEEKDGEKRQAFLKRVAVAVGKKLTDEQFDKLTEPAQEWYNKAAKASKAGKELPEFPDATDEGNDEGEDEKPAKKGAKKESKPVREKDQGPSAKSELVKLRLQNPFAPVDDLVAKLEKMGHKLTESTVRTIDGHARGVIKVAMDIGWTVPSESDRPKKAKPEKEEKPAKAAKAAKDDDADEKPAKKAKKAAKAEPEDEEDDEDGDED